VTNFYRITAVDSSDNESAFRTFPPTGPRIRSPRHAWGLGGGACSTSIVLDWSTTANGLAGYNVYRSTSSGSGFVKNQRVADLGVDLHRQRRAARCDQLLPRVGSRQRR